MTWFWVYLIQAAIVTIVATRLAFKMGESYETPGDAATMGLLIGLFWPVGLFLFAALGGVHFLFEGLGKVLTLGTKA